jgi:hypothetical protein
MAFVHLADRSIRRPQAKPRHSRGFRRSAVAASCGGRLVPQSARPAPLTATADVRRCGSSGPMPMRSLIAGFDAALSGTDSGKPEARAEGKHRQHQEATRIPSARASGFQAGLWHAFGMNLSSARHPASDAPTARSAGLGRQRAAAAAPRRPCSPGGASSRPSGRTSAAAATAQANIGGMPMVRVRFHTRSWCRDLLRLVRQSTHRPVTSRR